jgi:hypothetical protein
MNYFLPVLITLSAASASAEMPYTEYHQRTLINGKEQPAHTVYRFEFASNPSVTSFLYKFEYPAAGFRHESKSVFDFEKVATLDLQDLYLNHCDSVAFQGTLEEVTTPAGTFLACKIVMRSQDATFIQWKAGIRPLGTVKEHLIMNNGNESVTELHSFSP